MPNDLNLERVVRGYKSRVTVPESYVVQTAEDWEDLHQRLNKRGRSPSHYGLEYYFSTITLLAVCLGEVAKGSAVKIIRASDIGGRIEVDVQQNILGNSGVWQPYDVVFVPKVTKAIDFKYSDNPNLKVSGIRPINQ